MSNDSQFELKHFDKYIRLYNRLLEIALFQIFFEMESSPEDRPVITLNERLGIISKITRNKFVDRDSFKMSEDQIYEDLRTEYDSESFDKVAVNCLREDEKH